MNARFLRGTLCFAFLLVSVPAAFANNVQISNISIINNGPGAIQVQFDLSWENSWRTNVGQANYDGVWVFFKYKDATGLWKHMGLSASGTFAYAGGYGVTFLNSTVAQPGIMFFRSGSNLGAGTATLTGCKIPVMSTLPYNVDIRGFAQEMVYIPAATAANMPLLGDGDGANESLYAFHTINNTAGTSPISVDAGPDDAALTTSGITINPADTITVNSATPVTTAFPTYKAMWCMKYELSQAGYRDFLNTLTLTQQTARTAAAPTSAAGTGALASTIYRPYIQIATPSTGGAPAIYGCNANGNTTYDEASDGEWTACHYLTWMDAAAYLDWAGLAPMTEIEYERICRGYTSAGANAAVYGEYAWGNAALYTPPSSTYTVTNGSTASETVNASTTQGNANWNSSYPGYPYSGPLRSGIFATATSNRITSGAAFFGVMEMTGNLLEYTISIGSTAGRSTGYVPNGDGTISAAGNAQLSISALPAYWPGMENNSNTAAANTCAGSCEVTNIAGIKYRGGHFTSAPGFGLAVSDRTGTVTNSRLISQGCRGVIRQR